MWMCVGCRKEWIFWFRSVLYSVCVLVVAVGEVAGRVHPLHWLMCNCVLLMCSFCLLVLLRGCFFLVGLGIRGLRVCLRDGCCLCLGDLSC